MNKKQYITLAVALLLSIKISFAQEVISESVFGSNAQRCNFFNYEGPTVSNNAQIYQVNSAIAVNGVATNKSGDIYAGAWDNLLYSFSKELKLKWTFKTDGKIRRGPLVVNDTTIYFGSTDGYLYSLTDLGNKSKLNWKYKTDSAVWSYPITDKIGNIYFGSDDKYIYSLSNNGQLNWKYGPLNNWPGDGVAITKEGNLVFGTWDGILVMLNQNGKLLWKNNLDAAVRAMPVVSSENNIYVGTTGGNLYCFDISGKQLFKLKIDGAIRNSICINPANEVFFGTANNSVNGRGGTSGTLYKITAKSEIIWKVDVPHVFSGGILDKASKFYCGSDNGEIYCYDSQGKLIWTFDREYPKILVKLFTENLCQECAGGEAMALTKEGTLIFGSDIGLLYTIKK